MTGPLARVVTDCNQKTWFLNQIEKNTKDIVGRRAVLALHTGENSGVGARPENGTLPAAGQQGYTEERVPVKYNYGRIQISGPTIKAMASDKGAYLRAVDSETKGLVKNLRSDVNRQVWGTSDGVIAATAANTAVTVVALAASTTEVQMRQFRVNMVIDIGTVATPTSVTSARTITAVDATAKTITISGAAVTTATTDRVFRTGSGGAGSAQKEMTGVRSIILDSGILFNVDPTLVPVWKSIRRANGGVNRTLSENLLAEAMMAVDIESGEEIDLWVTSDGVFRAFANLLTSLKRTVNSTELKGGYKGLSMTAGGKEVPLVWEKDAPANRAYGISTSHLIQYEMSDWEWMDEDGAVLNRVPNTDAYEATFFRYAELATDARNAHAVVEDITAA